MIVVRIGVIELVFNMPVLIVPLSTHGSVPPFVCCGSVKGFDAPGSWVAGAYVGYCVGDVSVNDGGSTRTYESETQSLASPPNIVSYE